MLVAVLKFYLDYVIHSELVAMKFNQNIIAVEDTLLLHIIVLMVSFILFFLSVLVFHCAYKEFVAAFMVRNHLFYFNISILLTYTVHK